MLLELPLECAPHPKWIGVGLHGQAQREAFLIPDAWCLHLFRDPLDLRVNGHAIEVTPGTATLIAPGESIEFHFPRRTHHVHAFAHFRVEEGGNPQPFPRAQQLGQDFERSFADLSEAVGYWAQGSPRAAARLWDLLWRLCTSEPRKDGGRGDALVTRAREIIELRLSETLMVSALARELSVSHNHLTRRFHAETGQTVVEFIRTRRTERAVYLLERTTLPIKAIARSCGLGDFHSFGKVLRRETGRSPRSFREERELLSFWEPGNGLL